MNRPNDPDNKAFFKSERYFESNGQWYFSTREGEDQGPFSTRDIAIFELNAYLKTQAGILTDAWEEPGARR